MAHNVLPIRGERFDGADFGEAVSAQFERRVARVLSDRFDVREVIGVGSMGVVFRGVQRTSKREVAIKVALPLLAPDQRARFRREAELGGRFEHPNCVRVEEFAVADGDLEYMILTLVRGRPLAEMLGERVPIERAVDWAMQMLRGVQHIHEQGIVHRDLKPGNVLVETDATGRQTLRIADYGIAKPMLRADSLAIDTLSRETMTGLMAGTPAYMAPEQAMALGCDRRSDLYSVGLVVYEIVTGALPRPEDDAFDQMRARLTEDVSLLLSFVPAPLAMIIGKLLRARPEERYPTAAEALEDLEAFLAGRSLPHAGRDALAPPPVAASLDLSGSFRPTRSLPANDQVPRVAHYVDDEPQPPRRLRVGSLLGVAALGGAVVAVVLWQGGALAPREAPAIVEPRTEPRTVVVPEAAAKVAATPDAHTRAPRPPAARRVDEAPAEPPVAAATPERKSATQTASKKRKSSRTASADKPAAKKKTAAKTTESAPAVPRAPLLQDGLRKPSGM